MNFCSQKLTTNVYLPIYPHQIYQIIPCIYTSVLPIQIVWFNNYLPDFILGSWSSTDPIVSRGGVSTLSMWPSGWDPPSSSSELTGNTSIVSTSSYGLFLEVLDNVVKRFLYFLPDWNFLNIPRLIQFSPDWFVCSRKNNQRLNRLNDFFSQFLLLPDIQILSSDMK